jgi:hypothetical protein
MQRVVLLRIHGLVQQAFRGPLEHGQPHREMKPVQEMLRVWVQIELEIPHGVAAIGEKSNLLVELVALQLEHLEEPPFRFLVMRLYERKALTGDWRFGLFSPREGQQTLAGNHLEPALPAEGTDVAPIDAHG